MPPLDFLQPPEPTAKFIPLKAELEANARLIQQTLASFGIKVALGNIIAGPTITRYELHTTSGESLARIVKHSQNLTTALKSENLHVLAPVPGKSSVVGVEVPNLVRTKVCLRECLDSEVWRDSKARLPIVLGQDIYDQTTIADLATWPHCLIAGGAGSGKSVCLNVIIASLLYRFSPEQLRFVLLDSKSIELQQYGALPHLAMPVATDPQKIRRALRWVIHEIEKRLHLFARCGVRNIDHYNQRPKDQSAPLRLGKNMAQPGAGLASKVDTEPTAPGAEKDFIPEKLARVVVILSELADLLASAPADFEMIITRITQMAAVAGVHCLIATRQPVTDIITDNIRTSLPARMAFQVGRHSDSRAIFDALGAEKLLGAGDLLYLPPRSVKLIRIQGAWITDAEIQRVVNFIAGK